MLNKIFLQGRLVADPEMRHTPSGVAVATLRLAVDRDFKDRETGEKKADFINVVAWRATAEFVSRYFTKGRMAIVEGRLQMRDWTDKDGNKRTTAEVVADNVYFGDSKRDGERRQLRRLLRRRLFCPGPQRPRASPGLHRPHGRRQPVRRAGRRRRRTAVLKERHLTKHHF